MPISSQQVVTKGLGWQTRQTTNAVKLRICMSRYDFVRGYRLLRFLKLLRSLRFSNVLINASVIISIGEPQKLEQLE